MIRVRSICTVKYGKAREFMQANEALNEVCKARGWVPAILFGAVAGAFNEFVVELDYPDLATYEEEFNAQMTDTEFMAIFRGSADLIYPQSGRGELYETVVEIA